VIKGYTGPFKYSETYGWSSTNYWADTTTGVDAAVINGYTITDGATVRNLATSGTIKLYKVGHRNVEFHTGIAPTSLPTLVEQKWNPTVADEYHVSMVTIPAPTDIGNGWVFRGYRATNDASSNVKIASGEVGRGVAVIPYNAHEYRSIYERNITVNYKANGGTGTMTPTTVHQYYNSGRGNGTSNSGANITTPTVTLSANGFTAPVGHSFSGKWAKGSPSGTQYNAESSYTEFNDVSVSNEVTMYAISTANTYTVHFSSNGGQGGQTADVTAT
jgi:hypothetical protein